MANNKITTIVSITYPAKCKDCEFCISYPRGKRKRHYCANKKSPRSGDDVSLKDKVCDVWSMHGSAQ
jgi:hypothetical protein